MKNFFIFTVLACSVSFTVTAQSQASFRTGSSTAFIDYQRSFPRASESLKRKEDTLRKQFAAKNLTWPANYIYVRSFKYDSQLEVWVKNEVNEQFKLFKTYKVCALAGTLGPKRMEGDYQVPEGFYYINEFNPNSTYYLSLGINYPNESDKVLSDLYRPGSSIYIHGSCVTVGCIPITDQQIDELYILAAYAKNQGQDYIPVHIFPVRFNVPKSVNYLSNMTKDDPSLRKFASRLEDAFDYFEKYKQLPVILIKDDGEYIVNSTAGAKTAIAANAADNKAKPVAKKEIEHRKRDITGLTESVHEWPKFPGGTEAFMKYLKEVGTDMVAYLPKKSIKAYVQVEFIVDSDGTPTNFKVLKGVNDEDFNNELITRLDKMPEWQPAVLNDQPVPKKLVQTIEVQAK